MKINLSKITAEVIFTLKKYPVEACVGFLFFVFFCIEDLMDWENHSVQIGHIRDVMALFPFFIVLVYSLHQLPGKAKIAYYASVLLPLPFLWVDLSHFVYSISWTFTLLLAVFMLLACKGKWKNLSFAQNGMHTFTNLIVTFFISHLLALAVWGLYSAVIYIFNIGRGDFPEYIYMFSLFVVTPLLFCHLHEKEGEGKATPRFMEIIINYILSPAVIAYTAIFYLYFITIVVRWELPKGGIGYMVLALVIFAMAGHMSQLLVSRNMYGWFYSRFSWIAIPPLMLFWIGTVERITTYGFTASRVYLLAAGILMTLYVFFFLSRKMGNYQLMAVISCVCIAVLTFVPGITAKSIGIYSQKQRLEKYISRLDMLDSTTHKLKLGTVFNETDSVRRQDARELKACYFYLADEKGNGYMEERYGKCDILIDWDWHYMRASFPLGIDMEGYARYYPIDSDYGRIFTGSVENGVAMIRRKSDGKVIISRDIDAYMNSHRDKIIEEAADSTNLELFVTRNDSCMMVLTSIDYETSTGFHCTDATFGAVFIK